MSLCFVDLETTGLDEERCEIWEIGLIVRDHEVHAYDGEWAWMIHPSLRTAEPSGLRVGKFYSRFPTDIGSARLMISPVSGYADRNKMVTRDQVAAQLAPLLDGTQPLVSAISSFDTAFLRKFLTTYGQAATWHHRVRCIESVVEGHVGRPVGGLKDCMAALNLPFDVSAQHTALGDARACRDIWDTIFGTGDETT